MPSLRSLTGHGRYWQALLHNIAQTPGILWLGVSNTAWPEDTGLPTACLGFCLLGRCLHRFGFCLSAPFSHRSAVLALAATMTGFVGTLPISKGNPPDMILPLLLTTLAVARCSSDLVCRLDFVYDIKVETQTIQADIARMQQQLQMFDNHTNVPSAYAQKHAVDPNYPAYPTQNNIVPAPATLRPFLFVGVLSVAINAGMPALVPCTLSIITA